jgi:hypothetical protein
VIHIFRPDHHLFTKAEDLSETPNQPWIHEIVTSTTTFITTDVVTPAPRWQIDMSGALKVKMYVHDNTLHVDVLIDFPMQSQYQVQLFLGREAMSSALPTVMRQRTSPLYWRYSW